MSVGNVLVTATWGNWESWNLCPVTCGGGNRIRMRECNDPDATAGACDGEQPTETKVCNSEDCRK